MDFGKVMLVEVIAEEIADDSLQLEDRLCRWCLFPRMSIRHKPS
jgi:hypothetical protein